MLRVAEQVLTYTATKLKFEPIHFLCYADAARFTCTSLLWLTITVSLGGCAMLFKEQGVTVMVCHTCNYDLLNV